MKRTHEATGRGTPVRSRGSDILTLETSHGFVARCSAARRREACRNFVALELSKSTWLVAVHAPAADKISLHRLQGGNTEGLMAPIEGKREQAQIAVARPVRMMATGDYVSVSS